MDRWTAAAERAMPRVPVERRPALEAGAAALRAALGHDGVARMRADALQAADRDSDGSLRALACLLAGVAHHLSGDVAGARRPLEDGARPGADTAPVPEALCLAQLALIALVAEEWEEAERLAERARSRVSGVPLRTLPCLALVPAVGACARAHRLRIADAREDVAVCRGLLARLDRFAPWYVALTTITLARAELRVGNVAESRALLAEASRQSRRVVGAPLLAQLVDDAWARVDTFAAESLAGPSSLTTAELRVLRFLPSHFTFREIAERLHVSANTVKTQAHAVYRKLGASSRSAAVERARRLGLVEG